MCIRNMCCCIRNLQPKALASPPRADEGFDNAENEFTGVQFRRIFREKDEVDACCMAEGRDDSEGFLCIVNSSIVDKEIVPKNKVFMVEKKDEESKEIPLSVGIGS